MRYLVTWFDEDGEVVDMAETSYLHAVRLLKREKCKEAKIPGSLENLRLTGEKAIFYTENHHRVEFEKVKG